MLSEPEKNLNKTNDLKKIDSFRILKNFIDEVFTLSKNVVDQKQFQKFVFVLEEYASIKPFFQPTMHSKDIEHLKKRKSFVKSSTLCCLLVKLRIKQLCATVTIYVFSTSRNLVSVS